MPTATVFDSSIAEGNPISRSAGHKIFFALQEEFPVKQKKPQSFFLDYGFVFNVRANCLPVYLLITHSEGTATKSGSSVSLPVCLALLIISVEMPKCTISL